MMYHKTLLLASSRQSLCWLRYTWLRNESGVITDHKHSDAIPSPGNTRTRTPNTRTPNLLSTTMLLPTNYRVSTHPHCRVLNRLPPPSPVIPPLASQNCHHISRSPDRSAFPSTNVRRNHSSPLHPHLHQTFPYPMFPSYLRVRFSWMMW